MYPVITEKRRIFEGTQERKSIIVLATCFNIQWNVQMGVGFRLFKWPITSITKLC